MGTNDDCPVGGAGEKLKSLCSENPDESDVPAGLYKEFVATPPWRNMTSF